MKKLAICVPHYKREEHLKKFIPHMDEFFKDKDIEYKIFVANQVYPDSVSGFNRGTAKNVAFDVAQKEGYDYFCFHDIDMLPEDDTCDYSYPDKVEHLAVNVAQFGYGLKYQEYFGGAILFTKEHYQKINGYSNGYFNWGMEDDDLLYRVKKKGLAKTTFMNNESNEPRNFARFDGLSNYIKINPTDSIRELTSGNFTISILVKAEDRFDIPTYLIGDVENREFIHQYILGRPSYQMGFAWDNSNAYSFGLFNQKNNHSYMWIKRHPETWTHLMITVNVDKGEMRFYLNGEESDSRFGHGSESPLKFESPLKKYGGNPFYIGVNDPKTADYTNYFAGDITQVCMWDRIFDDSERQEYYKTDFPTPENTKLYYDFSKVENDIVYDLSGNGNHGIINGCSIINEEIGKISNTTLPYRSRKGRYFSQHHKRNDIVGNKFVHQKDTSINERRFIDEVKGGMINTDEDGLADLNYNIVKREYLFNTEHEIIDFRCEQDIPNHVEI
ncbi:hypothetical protein HOE22_00235 [Candidatus Woesearchaeota archaeon]|jgi:beta-1,4-galactosyltransferase 1|nr:hypothetical protein [Candidatus Neomarinimicrobiota bacterium]MBT4206755.1 hypothetical protein [Candidatus Woesearchaeota archaeon]